MAKLLSLLFGPIFGLGLMMTPHILGAMVFFNSEQYQQQLEQQRQQQQQQQNTAAAGSLDWSPSATSATAYCQSASLDYPPGTIVTVACPSGYELVGTDASTCNTGGFWSTGGIGFCRRRASVKHCETPQTPENAFIADHKIHDDHYEAGDFILYECQDGFKFEEGEVGKILCHPSGFWSDELPVCKRKSPIRTKSEQHGQQQQPQQTTSPTTTTTAVSSRQLAKRCLLPEKQRNAHIVGLPSGVTPAKDYEADDFIRYVCDEGFEMKENGGEAVITCQPNGSWSGEMPNCEKTPSKKMDIAASQHICQGPETPENAYIVEQSRPQALGRFPLGSYITYDCIYDFAMTGEKTIFCGMHGKWSNVTPKCTKVMKAVININNQQPQQQRSSPYGKQDYEP